MIFISEFVEIRKGFRAQGNASRHKILERNSNFEVPKTAHREHKEISNKEKKLTIPFSNIQNV